MKYVHHPDYTCLTQYHAFDAGHQQIERYTFPFKAHSEELVKDAIRAATKAAIESRGKRGLSTGRLHVEIDEDAPFSGRVVDHIPRDATGNLDTTQPAESASSNDVLPSSEVEATNDKDNES